MKADICLINPPLDKKTTSKFPMSGIPLGIASLAAYLREKKLEAAVIDSPIKGWDFEKTAKIAISTGTKIIGVSCLTENRYSAIKTLEKVKKINPGIVTIIGGLHATFSDKLLLENYPFIDIVVKGEGEETLYELIKKIKAKKSLEKVKGISYRTNGQIKINPLRPFIEDIEKLPLPAYELFPMKEYPLPPDVKGKVNQTSLVTTSRGCPMGCKFCETTFAWGRKIRSTSAKRLYEHVKYLYDNFGIDYIRFADDLFTIKKEKVIEFCELVIKNKLPIRFRIQARVDTVDEEMVKMLKKAGCDLIEYGAESGSNKVLFAVGKNITVDKIKDAVELTKKVGIDVKYFLIVGLLEEGPNETWETFELIKDTKPDWIGINALTIYPGTCVYDIAKKEGLINDELWLNYINPKTGNAPLYTKIYSDKEMIFLAQMAHVWACKNSSKFYEYPKLEKIIARLANERVFKMFVKNNFARKTGATIAWLMSGFLP
jgi:radical SAM superfamily enzyme YgiQ (UPF0313 family)